MGYGNLLECEDESLGRAIKSLLSGKNRKKYESENEDNFGIVIVNELTPIQMPNLDLEEIFEGRKNFSKEEWIDLLLRSIGMEPTQLQEREKWHLLERLVPLVENNYNLCELGPRSTGKSHVYKEISPNSILVSGGQTTVANLFYNMGRRQVGLVGNWDVVAFDEVAGINFKDKDGIQIMKDYMNSGSFVRGKDEVVASASMVFVGNINYSIDGMDEGTLSKTKEMLDDMHKRKIDMSDEIFVINVGGYIGDSTRSEIDYAKAHGKKVNYLESIE